MHEAGRLISVITTQKKISDLIKESKKQYHPKEQTVVKYKAFTSFAFQLLCS